MKLKLARIIEVNGERFVSVEDLCCTLARMKHGKEPERVEDALVLMKVGIDMGKPKRDIVATVIGSFLCREAGLDAEAERRN